MAYFWVYQDNKNEWRWKFIASNGKTIAVSSEGYVNKSDCLRGVELMQSSGGAIIIGD